MRTLFISVILLAFSGAAFALPVVSVPRETNEDRAEGYVGRRIVPFEAGTVSGKTVSSADFGGRILLIDLRDLTCVFWLDELRALEEV